MMQVGTNQSATYHSQSSLGSTRGQRGRSSSASRQQHDTQHDNDQFVKIRPRLCILRKWPHYDGYGVHLARNQHWLGLRIGDVEPNSPAESGGLLREDVVLAVNGQSVENDDFFVILSFIQHELEDDHIRFLVLDPQGADLVRRHQLSIDENYQACVRMETPTFTVSPEKLLYDQWRAANNIDPTTAQNIVNLGPTSSINQHHPSNVNTSRFQSKSSRDGADVYTFLPYSDHAIEDGRSFFDVLFDQETSLSSAKAQQPYNDHHDHQKEKFSSSSINDKSENKFQESSYPTHTTDHGIKPKVKSQPYGSSLDTASKLQDINKNLRPETRMCSLKLRPGIDTIGISLQPDKDFGHIIKSVEPNSLADRAGIERDDCIVSLNDTPLLNIPYEDVLNVLRRSRNEQDLDFLVAKKSYLLKSSQNGSTLPTMQNDLTQNTSAEVMPSSNMPGKDTSSAVPPAQALEQLYNKYANDQQSLPDDRYSTKQQQQSGQIFQGVGPATADRSSWGVTSGKAADLPAPTSGTSSIRSDTRGRRPDTEETKGRSIGLEDSFKPLQVGITNQTPSQQTVPSTEQRDTSPKVSPSLDKGVTHTPGDVSPSSQTNQSIQNIPATVPIATNGTSSAVPDYEQGHEQITPSTQSDLRLGPSKVMSVPNKQVKISAPSDLYDETDDDLSDILEKSDEEEEEEEEEETSATVPDKYSQLAVAKPSHGAPDAESSKTQTSVLTASDIDSENNKLSPAISRQVVKARRLEQSDSEDTNSGVDSLPVRLATGESYLSSDEHPSYANNTDNQLPRSLNPYTSHAVDQTEPSNTKHDQVLSRRSNQSQKPTNNESDEDDEDSNVSITSDNENPSVKLETKALATMTLSELRDYGYEFHNIQLMQPTETSPVGLKLTKQHDPLQYVITAVAKGTKADLAGLKVNDWLIKIEDNDVRLVDFGQVSQDIRQLLTTAGLINMVVARKSTPTSTSTPIIQKIDKQQTPSSASRPESLSRQQGVNVPASLLTTDITRDTPNNSQVRFVPEPSTSPPPSRSQRSPPATRENNFNAPAPSSVGLTNPISDTNIAKSPRSPSRSPTHSPTRESTINQDRKKPSFEQTAEEYDEKDIRHVVLKEALGLDFNSFIPEGESETQTHFISNVQSGSMADKAGLRDGDRILTVNGVDVKQAIHEDVRRMMQTKKPLQLTVVNDPKYLELIESVKLHKKEVGDTRDKKNSPPPDYETLDQQRSGNLRADTNDRSRSPNQSLASDVKSDVKSPQKSPDSLKQTDDDPSGYYDILFTDNNGAVRIKHCILKKDPNYNGYGLVLRYQHGLHLIDQVEGNSPAFKAGLREQDIMLYVDKKNVESMTHDDVKILIRKLSVLNTNIDLILMKKDDIERYKDYQKNNTIDWKPIVEGKYNTEPLKTVQATLNSNRPSNDAIDLPRHSTSSSTSSAGKQTAAAPTASSSSQSTLPPSTRVCVLQPSADRTAGFALSGKTAPPYVICQVEKNSPAEKAGLVINDALISINGISVVEASYEETVKLVKEALQSKSVELVVRDHISSSSNEYSKSQDQTKVSIASGQTNNLGTKDSLEGEPSQQGANAVEEYQKQRNKELSYTLRLCHLHPTNADGSHAATFGFELSEEPEYEYPIILRVEPQSPAEGAGLQSRDVLLKINERKTKGLGYEKVKKEIEKAKRDGRLEMLVVDQETFDYCQRTQKSFKEPDIKVKHIFPKSRSSASFHKLPVVAAMGASSASINDNVEQWGNSSRASDGSIASYSHVTFGTRLPTQKETDSENEDNENQISSEQKSSVVTTSHAKSARTSHPAVSFDLSPPPSTFSQPTAHLHESPLKFFDSARTTSQQTGASSSLDQSVPNTSQSTTSLSRTSKESKLSKAKSIPHAINSLFNKIGHSKSSKRS